MKKSRLTDSQTMAALQRAVSGLPVPEICRQPGISNATFYKCRAKFGGTAPCTMTRMKELEDENRRLIKMHLEAKLKSKIVTEIFRTKVERPSRRREMAQGAVQMRSVPIRLACAGESCYRYESKHNAENDEVANSSSARKRRCLCAW